MYYPGRGIHGLPGGHVEVNEDPDDTIKRELLEELTLVVDTMKHANFFLHPGKHSRIILGYTAIASIDVSIIPTRPGFEHGTWIKREDLDSITISDVYRNFIVENWPKL